MMHHVLENLLRRCQDEVPICWGRCKMKDKHGYPKEAKLGEKIIIECSGGIFVGCILSGIWIQQIRWRLIATGIFFLIVAISQHGIMNKRIDDVNHAEGEQ